MSMTPNRIGCFSFCSFPLIVCLFVCCSKTRKSIARPGREINPLGVYPIWPRDILKVTAVHFLKKHSPCQLQNRNHKQSQNHIVLVPWLLTIKWQIKKENRRVALLQSNMGCLMKILKSCFKVIQRTGRSRKNWLRYSSFSAISRVKLPNLQAWSNFEHFKTIQPTLTEHDNVSKNKNFQVRNGSTCRGCASQKTSNHICRKKFDFFAQQAEKSPQYRHFTRQIAFSRSLVVPILRNFW